MSGVHSMQPLGTPSTSAAYQSPSVLHSGQKNVIGLKPSVSNIRSQVGQPTHFIASLLNFYSFSNSWCYIWQCLLFLRELSIISFLHSCYVIWSSKRQILYKRCDWNFVVKFFNHTNVNFIFINLE